MALPPWAVSAIRRGILDVARKAGDAETIAKLKNQATEILRDFPEGAARSVDALVQSAKAGKDAIERWIQGDSEIAVHLLNASGELFHPKHGSGLALNDRALHAGVDLLRGNCDVAGRRERIQAAMRGLIPGSSAIMATHLVSAASAISLIAGERPITIHRSHAIGLSGGCALPDLFSSERVRQIGGAQGADPSDFRDVHASVVVLADAGQAPFHIPDSIGSENEVIVVLPIATVLPKWDAIPSAKQCLDSGASLVILPTDGVQGGPEGALMIGDPEMIEKLSSDPLMRGYLAHDAISAMLLQRLESEAENAEDGDVSDYDSAFESLVSVSEDNLRSRAERMATRLTGQDDIASCQITDDVAKLTRNGHWHYPSRQLRLRHVSWSAAEWSAKLAQGSPVLATRVEGEDLVVDLRWIQASDDPSLAECFESH